MHRIGWNDVPLIVSETLGAESFHEAIKQGKVVTLPTISSIARTLGAKTVCQEVFDWTKKHDVKSVTVTDRSAVESVIKFSEDHRILVEPACGAGLSVVYEKMEPLMNILENSKEKEPTIIVIICGGNMTNLTLIDGWKKQFSIA